MERLSIWKWLCLSGIETYENLKVTIKANKFAKGITLRLPENEKYIYSDNYFDLEAGEEKKVFIFGVKELDAKELVVTDFAKETKRKGGMVLWKEQKD